MRRHATPLQREAARGNPTVLANDALSFLLAHDAPVPVMRDLSRLMLHIGKGLPVTPLMRQHLRIAAALAQSYESGDEQEGAAP